MRNPPTEPPGPPLEPFLQHRTPPTGTLLGLQRPPAPVAPAALGGAVAPTQAPAGDLERHLEGLRLELARFREWLPEQLARPMPRPRPRLGTLAAAAPPPLPGSGGRRRELQSSALVACAGTLLAVALALASASAALRWPAYGRLVARLGGVPAHSR